MRDVGGKCTDCPRGWEPDVYGTNCAPIVCMNRYYWDHFFGECIQDDCSGTRFTNDKEGKCTVSRCEKVREYWRYPPSTAYANLDDILQGYNIFEGTPFA